MISPHEDNPEILLEAVTALSVALVLVLCALCLLISCIVCCLCYGCRRRVTCCQATLLWACIEFFMRPCSPLPSGSSNRNNNEEEEGNSNNNGNSSRSGRSNPYGQTMVDSSQCHNHPRAATAVHFTARGGSTGEVNSCTDGDRVHVVSNDECVKVLLCSGDDTHQCSPPPAYPV
uniref:Uncharacterized protein 26 n=1 Tax=Halisarca dujardinii TaxID=2583056 RepID=A0AA96MI61_HALDU|nr:uncharacterized protein 26 [Halisarca dujardinii]